MDTIEELAADERTARVILAVASEPADAALARHFDSVFPAYKASREALSPLWETITGQQDKLP